MSRIILGETLYKFMLNKIIEGKTKAGSRDGREEDSDQIDKNCNRLTNYCLQYRPVSTVTASLNPLL
jgi:hypothetical protein